MAVAPYLSAWDRLLLIAGDLGFWPTVSVLTALVVAGVAWAHARQRGCQRRAAQPEWERWVRQPDKAKG